MGHTISTGLCGSQNSKITMIREAARPTTKRQMRSFLGLARYYHIFIPNFSVIALSLTDLLKKHSPNKVMWGPDQEEAFSTLKDLLYKEPILQLPDFIQPFILQTGASQECIGAAFIWEGDGEVFPVAYHSRKLKPAKRNDSMVKELLAVVDGIEEILLLSLQ